MQYGHISDMEDYQDHTTWIRPEVQAGDWCVFGAWKFTVTEQALHCDCGKAMFCPYVTQERV